MCPVLVTKVEWERFRMFDFGRIVAFYEERSAFSKFNLDKRNWTWYRNRETLLRDVNCKFQIAERMNPYFYTRKRFANNNY